MRAYNAAKCELTALPPDPLADFKGWEGEGSGGEGKGKGKRGKGKGKRGKRMGWLTDAQLEQGRRLAKAGPDSSNVHVQ